MFASYQRGKHNDLSKYTDGTMQAGSKATATFESKSL